MIPEFLKPYEKKALTFLETKKVKEIIFSENTYEVEVVDPTEKDSPLWPFLQIDDEGNVFDSFCTCKESEKKGGCVHLCCSYMRICHKQNKALHV